MLLPFGICAEGNGVWELDLQVSGQRIKLRGFLVLVLGLGALRDRRFER